MAHEPENELFGSTINLNGRNDVDDDDGAITEPSITEPSITEPPITELDIRMIAHSLHDQGRGQVLVDMVEAVTGVRPPDDTYSPRKLPIRDPEWRKARRKAERSRRQTERRARMTDEEKAKQIGNLQLWKANNPDKIQAAKSREVEKRKAARKSRDWAAVDLEGFNTHRYFTDDRRDYARELHEGIARGMHQNEQGQKELDQLLRDHIVISEEERLAQQVPFAGWTVHNHAWYLSQHGIKTAQNLCNIIAERECHEDRVFKSFSCFSQIGNCVQYFTAC